MRAQVRGALWNAANMVSLSRVVASPILIFVILQWAPSWWVFAIVVIAVSTDSLDGWLARKFGPTNFGGFIDSLADKIVMLSAFGALIARGWVSPIPVAIMAVREVAMSAWRTKLARRNVYVPARTLGKRKAFAQNVAIALTVAPGVMSHASWLSVLAVWVAVVLALVSFALYLRDGARL